MIIVLMETKRDMRRLAQPGDPAVVVFSDRSDLAWLRLLRPGFRHCFVVLRRSHGWLAVEALSNATVVSELPDAAAGEIAEAYRRAGHRSAIVRCHDHHRAPLPWAPFTCVESVKRLIGMRAPGIMTPYQLWERIILEIGKNT